MALPLLALGIGAAGGLAKHYLMDKPKEQRQRALAAETTRWSPWTGMQAGPVQEADPFSGALQGATLGALMSTGFKGGADADIPPDVGGDAPAVNTAPMTGASGAQLNPATGLDIAGTKKKLFEAGIWDQTPTEKELSAQDLLSLGKVLS